MMMEFFQYVLNWDPHTYPLWHNVLLFISCCVFGWLAAIGLLHFALLLAIGSMRGILKEHGLDEEGKDWDPWS